MLLNHWPNKRASLLAVLILLVCIAAKLLASSLSTEQPEQVREAAIAYSRDVQKGQYREACQRTVDRVNCERQMKLMALLFAGNEVKQKLSEQLSKTIDDIKHSPVVIQDNQATIKTKVRPIRLVKKKDQWLIMDNPKASNSVQ